MAIWPGIMLDGIPESLVVGSSMIHAQVSMSLIAGLFLSNYPEALSSSVGMRQQGMSFARVLFMWSSLTLFTGIGAALGNVFFVGADPAVVALVEGVAAGAMLTMIAQTMAPELSRSRTCISFLMCLYGGHAGWSSSVSFRDHRVAAGCAPGRGYHAECSDAFVVRA